MISKDSEKVKDFSNLGNAIVGVLLNNPSQDLNINERDKIVFYLAEDTQNGNLMCISNLDND